MFSDRKVWIAYGVLVVAMLLVAFGQRRPEYWNRPESPDDTETRLALRILVDTDWQRLLRCLDGNGGFDRDELSSEQRRVVGAMVLIGIESHARPRWVRVSELLVARSYLALTGRVPDMSLGIGQMKPRVAMGIMTQTDGAPPSQEEVLRALSDDCRAARLVYGFVTDKGNKLNRENRKEMLDLFYRLNEYNGRSTEWPMTADYRRLGGELLAAMTEPTCSPVRVASLEGAKPVDLLRVWNECHKALTP